MLPWRRSTLDAVIRVVSLAFIFSWAVAVLTDLPAAAALYDEFRIENLAASTFTSISSGCQVYRCHLIRVDPEPPRRGMKQGAVWLGVDEAIRGPEIKQLRIGYWYDDGTVSRPTPLPAIWPAIEGLNGAPQFLVLFVPGAHDAYCPQLEELPGAACQVYALKAENDPLVATFRRIIDLDRLTGVARRDQLTAAIFDADPVINDFVIQAITARLAPHEAFGPMAQWLRHEHSKPESAQNVPRIGDCEWYFQNAAIVGPLDPGDRDAAVVGLTTIATFPQAMLRETAIHALSELVFDPTHSESPAVLSAAEQTDLKKAAEVTTGSKNIAIQMAGKMIRDWLNGTK
jgi:hypothetical protein